MLACLPSGNGNGATATANWDHPIDVPGNGIYSGTSTCGSLPTRAPAAPVRLRTSTATTVSSQDGDYIQGETARFSIMAVFLDTNADPDAMVNSAMLTANALCTLATATPTAYSHSYSDADPDPHADAHAHADPDADAHAGRWRPRSDTAAHRAAVGLFLSDAPAHALAARTVSALRSRPTTWCWSSLSQRTRVHQHRLSKH